ncbi:MAG: hypothetical protein ABFD82_07900, partial [Syntrophaceae bacterium]
SLTLTTLALYQCSLRWFEARSCKPTSRDLPSSLVQPRGALTDGKRVATARMHLLGLRFLRVALHKEIGFDVQRIAIIL